MAQAAGIKMSTCRLLKENGRAHFMTKRFDREKSFSKHHILTLCAMSHLDYKKKSTNGYEQLFMTVRKLSLGHAAEVDTTEACHDALLSNQRVEESAMHTEHLEQKSPRPTYSDAQAKKHHAEVASHAALARAPWLGTPRLNRCPEVCSRVCPAREARPCPCAWCQSGHPERGQYHTAAR